MFLIQLVPATQLMLISPAHNASTCLTVMYGPQGCQQVGKALSVPPAAVLGGLLILSSFVMSPSVVTVPGTSWIEPALVWLTISMPTGSRKTTIFHFLRDILQRIRKKCQCKGKHHNIILVCIRTHACYCLSIIL